MNKPKKRGISASSYMRLNQCERKWYSKPDTSKPPAIQKGIDLHNRLEELFNEQT